MNCTVQSVPYLGLGRWGTRPYAKHAVGITKYERGYMVYFCIGHSCAANRNNGTSKKSFCVSIAKKPVQRKLQLFYNYKFYKP
jgi:hypothetical protein